MHVFGIIPVYISFRCVLGVPTSMWHVSTVLGHRWDVFCQLGLPHLPLSKSYTSFSGSWTFIGASFHPVPTFYSRWLTCCTWTARKQPSFTGEQSTKKTFQDTKMQLNCFRNASNASASWHSNTPRGLYFNDGSNRFLFEMTETYTSVL